jgi:hypothetical protein
MRPASPGIKLAREVTPARRPRYQTSTAGVAARRRKGQQANWSTKAKTRAYLIAESCLKQLEALPAAGRRDRGARRGLRVLAVPRGLRPAEVAHCRLSRPEWTDGHRHADALRVSSKEILKHLWRAGREWHLKHGREATS